ncbi:lipoprotein [Flavobacterium sp. MC2016-06]|jgi:hypothetical protein|uniref:lipoprotein n=1 Tax=Flavobacterium sp. MC2016-06 TaxID=2676308 RepID=UPI0012BAF568|nr:lipoprotein [Flavobacterium sp. MC2016-06]MBU3858318.1 lipoprotein [Flavobacterium sp. MC2016-06]
MKKITYLFFTLLLLTSCNADEAALKSLNGRWNWVNSSGGIAGTTNTPQSTNKTIVLEFKDFTKKTYVNDKLTDEVTFTIETRESIMGGNRKMIIITGGVTQTFVIEGNRLYLSDECYDCFQSSYKRIK